MPARTPMSAPRHPQAQEACLLAVSGQSSSIVLRPKTGCDDSKYFSGMSHLVLIDAYWYTCSC
jgi:hypothetical protein